MPILINPLYSPIKPVCRLLLIRGLLQNKKGKWKVTKRGREQYLKFLAKGIKDPAEIWLVWVQKGNDKLLSRRYITLFEDPKGQVKGYAAFDWVQSEWKGVTTFSPDELDYLDDQRKGYRIYAK